MTKSLTALSSLKQLSNEAARKSKLTPGAIALKALEAGKSNKAAQAIVALGALSKEDFAGDSIDNFFGEEVIKDNSLDEEINSLQIIVVINGEEHVLFNYEV